MTAREKFEKDVRYMPTSEIVTRLVRLTIGPKLPDWQWTNNPDVTMNTRALSEELDRRLPASHRDEHKG